MNEYSDKNPPKSGTAKRIYDVMKKNGITVHNLHYNPSCWGQGKDQGWGTWACDIVYKEVIPAHFVGWCGIKSGSVYLEQNRAPYNLVVLPYP